MICRFCKSKWISVGFTILTFAFAAFICHFSTFYYSFDDEDDEVRNVLKGPLAPDDERLVGYIRRHYLIPPSANEYNLSKEFIYKGGAKGYTWKSIHEKLHELFEKQPPGFFVEAGALDGEAFSNSLWLEQKKGWSGLLVEPDPMNFATLRKKSRKAWSSQSCLSSRPYPMEMTFSSIIIEREKMFKYWNKKGLTHNVINGFQHNADHTSDYNVYFTVQCLPLESLLLALNVTVVDFLSLDIQGGEWEVLKLFPYEKVKLRVIVVEYYNQDKKHRLNKDFIEFMSAKGYQLVWTSYEPDYLFVLRNDTYLSQMQNYSMEYNLN